jgi:nucleoside-diphosphate kinase
VRSGPRDARVAGVPIPRPIVVRPDKTRGLAALEEDMAVQRTFSIIKPDATAKNLVGKIVARFEAEGLRIAGIRKMRMSRFEAETFYAVHAKRPFFGELVEFMTSGPCVVMVLEGENAVLRNREIMGATDPAEAAPNTLRALYAESKGANAVHGSDAPETAAQEIALFFRESELS